MMLVEEAQVPTAALPISHFKDHLRLGSGFADDGFQDAALEAFLRAAMAAIEGRTGKALLSRSFSLTLGAWRNHDRHALPIAPVSAITGVTMNAADGTAREIAPALWHLVPDMQRPVLKARGWSLPVIPRGGSVTLRFTAGFGPDWSDLPPDLAQAVLMLAAHYHEYRHETALGAGCMPFGVSALTERYRAMRIFGGAGA